jgi:phage-related tail fiber protein
MPKGTNFYQMVTDCLNRHSAPAALNWARKYPSTAALNVPVADQQKLVNAFWRLQLGKLPINTIDARECLSDTVCPETWIKDFTKFVVPIIVANNLPT